MHRFRSENLLSPVVRVREKHSRHGTDFDGTTSRQHIIPFPKYTAARQSRVLAVGTARPCALLCTLLARQVRRVGVFPAVACRCGVVKLYDKRGAGTVEAV